MTIMVQKGDVAHPFKFLATNSTDHVSPVTGLLDAAFTVKKVSKNTVAVATTTGVVTEIGNGEYYYTPISTDVNTDGELAIHLEATGIDPVDILRAVIELNPYDVTAFGMTNLNATITSRQASSALDSGTAQGAGTGNNQLQLRAGAVASDSYYVNSFVVLTGGTGTGQARLITAYTGSTKTATLGTNWVTNPDATTTYMIFGFGTVQVGGVAPSWYTAPDNTDIASILSSIASLPASTATALLDAANAIDTGLTPRQTLRLLAAAMAGKISGAGTSNITVRDTADTKNRITATVDSNGDRTTISYDLS